MIWWYWILLGLVLAAIELATPGGFFFIFFAVAALFVGLIDLAGILESASLEWGLFTALSIACLVFFRKPLLKRINGGAREPVDSLVGELAMAVDVIPPGRYGRAQVRGSSWTVRNIDARPADAGERCRVVAVHGLELDIRPEEGA